MNRFFLGIFLVGSSLIFGVFVVWPRIVAFSVVKQEFYVKKAELESRENYFGHLADLADRLDDSQDLVAKIDAAIPNDSQLPGLHDFLQTLSAESGLVMRSISASQRAISTARLKPIDVSLQLGGSYRDMKSFLLSLLAASRMTDIQSLNFSTPAGGTNFVFNIRVSSYSY